MDMQQLKHYGFDFGPAAREWVTRDTLPRLARDAALATQANGGIPAEFASYIDPEVVDILTRPQKAREIFPEVKKGDWTSSHMKFRVGEMTGETEPYSDYAHSRTSGTNDTWVTRENYLFQTLIQYGDMEEAVNATARINLAAEKQRAAAHVLDADANRFYLLGIDGLEVYGVLNNPDISAPIAPKPVGGSAGTSPLWSEKTTKQKYEDVLYLFQELAAQTDGSVDKDSVLKLVMSPGLAVELGSATDFNVSVLDMLEKYFTNLKVVTVPELKSETTGETMMLVAETVNGQRTGELAYTVKVRAGRVVPKESSFSQKWVSGIWGAIVRQPLGVKQMRGM